MASLGCGVAMRAMASSMLPHVLRQDPTTMLCNATAGGILIYIYIYICYCSNLRQHRLEDTANDPNSPKANRRKGEGLLYT